jgi:glycosyltransferase 2 family protein
VKLLRRPTILAAAGGTVLLLGLLLVARPRDVGGMLARSRPVPLLIAFGCALVVALLRGLRLRAVVGARLPAGPALAVASLSQFAVQALPLRLGEIALFPLLRTVGVSGTIRTLSILVLVRALDMAAVLVWAAGAGLVLGTGRWWAFAVLLAVLPLAALASVGGQRALRALAVRWRHRGPRRRSLVRQLLAFRRELLVTARSPARALAIVLLSLAAWGAVWFLTVQLVRAISLSWPAAHVLLAMLGATAAAALPLNSVGNFGTLEAGWAATLAGLGVEPRQALAAGFATHVWSMVFTTAIAMAAWVYMTLSQAPTGARSWWASFRHALSRGSSDTNVSATRH